MRGRRRNAGLAPQHLRLVFARAFRAESSSPPTRVTEGYLNPLACLLNSDRRVRPSLSSGEIPPPRAPVSKTRVVKDRRPPIT